MAHGGHVEHAVVVPTEKTRRKLEREEVFVTAQADYQIREVILLSPLNVLNSFL